MERRSRERPRKVDGDSPLAARILTSQGPEMGHREGRSDVAGIGRASLVIARRAAFLAGVAPSGGWRPIQSP
jgi:hypothetical protein